MRLALALGVVGAALGAAPAQAAVVAVTDSGLRNPQTRIFTGQRVAFTNLTGAVVTIDSTGQPSFDDLVLPSGEDGERRFRRAGRYRYEATGRDGVIIVQGFARSPRPRPNGRDGCGGRKIYRYDIVVKGRKAVMETWLPEYRNEGAFSISYKYLASYPDVPLGVTDVCGGGKDLDLPAGRAKTAPGTGSLSGYTWSDSVQSAESGRPPSCAFTVATGRLGTQVTINGFLSPPGSGGGAAIASRLTTPQFEVLSSILDTKHDAVCDKDPGLSNSQVYDGLPGYDASADAIFSRPFNFSGGELYPPDISLFGDFAAFRQRGNPSEIGRKLSRGRSFSVSTTRTFDDTSSQTIAHGTASISISIRRR
jgi:hypothetical protein